jgi:hypothetical protein
LGRRNFSGDRCTITINAPFLQNAHIIKRSTLRGRPRINLVSLRRSKKDSRISRKRFLVKMRKKLLPQLPLRLRKNTMSFNQGKKKSQKKVPKERTYPDLKEDSL